MKQMKHPIPSDALDDRLGFIGTSGSGKTYNAGTAIEMLLASKARVVIIDPLGAWWGLRLLNDGKKPSNFNVVIFGGDHADLPLNEQAGALLGETAATMAESCIIDLRKLPSRSAERRFMVAFLETIYRKAEGEPFHLVVDEADLFAPQNPQKGDEVLLGHMDNIVRRGRMRGFIPWLISQRPAVLNKNVLSQVDGLLAFKLTASQDRDALDAWIEGQADKAQAKEIKDSLPTYQVGEGLVWLPGKGILERKPFPPKVTFDSSRKPKRGEKLKRRKLKPLNVEKLKEQLAIVVEEAKANDPKELKAELSRLKAELAKKPKVETVTVGDPKAVAQAEAKGRTIGKIEGYAEAVNEISEKWRYFTRNVASMLSGAASAAATADTHMTAILDRSTKKHVKQATAAATKAAKDAAKNPVSPTVSRIPVGAPVRSATVPTAPRPTPSPAASGDGSSRNGSAAIEQKLLNALAELGALGVQQPTRELVAMMAGYSLNTNSVKTAIVTLKNVGSIDYGVGTLILTAAGAAIATAAGAPADAAELRARIVAILGPPTDKLLTHLTEIYPQDCTREELAAACGLSINTNSVKSAIVKLKEMSFATYPAQGRVRADERLFPS